jgi:hypothetical protein
MTKCTWITTTVMLALLCLGASRDAGALTEQQCQYFEIAGRTAICHATSSPNRPYVLIESASQACVAHANHPADFVAINGSCENAEQLPAGAPCDATLGCSEELSCVNGFCGEQTAPAETSLIPRLQGGKSASNSTGFWRMTTRGIAPPSHAVRCVESSRSLF